jgi:hypothetical protein
MPVTRAWYRQSRELPFIHVVGAKVQLYQYFVRFAASLSGKCA